MLVERQEVEILPQLAVWRFDGMLGQDTKNAARLLLSQTLSQAIIKPRFILPWPKLLKQTPRDALRMEERLEAWHRKFGERMGECEGDLFEVSQREVGEDIYNDLRRQHL
jgi:hypothetical protein